MLPTEDGGIPARLWRSVTSYPPPAGVTLDIDEYLKSRIQFWVGENDNDPNHSQLDQSNETTSVQGKDRVERTANQFQAVVDEAAARGISPTDFRPRTVRRRRPRSHVGRGRSAADLRLPVPQSATQCDLPIKVLPRLVLTPSVQRASRSSLPQNVSQLDAGQQFYVELWVTAPSGGDRWRTFRPA